MGDHIGEGGPPLTDHSGRALDPPPDAGPAGTEVTPQPLGQRHPAELSTFIASLVAVAAAFGLDLSTEAVVGIFVLIGSLPAIVTWAVNLYRDAVRGLGD